MATVSGAPIDVLAAKFKASGLGAADTASALQNLGYSEKEAADATAGLGAEVVLTDPKVAALAAQVAELTAQLDRMSAASRGAGGGIQNVRGASQQAMVEMGALSGSSGMVERSLARLAATSSSLQPIIQAAFYPLLIVAFLEIVNQVDTAIVKMTDDLMGWTDVAKKAYAEAEAANFKQLETSLQLADQRERENTIGLEGEKKRATQTKDTTDEIKRQTEASQGMQHQVTELTEKSAELHAELKAIQEGDLAGHFGDWLRGDAFVKDVTAADEELARAQKHAEELAAELPKLQIKQEGGKLEDVAERTKEALDNEKARAESVRTLKLTEVAFDENMTRQLYEDHKITLEQETTDLLTYEGKKIQAARDNGAEEEKVLKARGATRPERHTGINEARNGAARRRGEIPANHLRHRREGRARARKDRSRTSFAFDSNRQRNRRFIRRTRSTQVGTRSVEGRHAASHPSDLGHISPQRQRPSRTRSRRWKKKTKF